MRKGKCKASEPNLLVLGGIIMGVKFDKKNQVQLDNGVRFRFTLKLVLMGTRKLDCLTVVGQSGRQADRQRPNATFGRINSARPR